MTTPWAEFEPFIRERAYKTLDRDPQILLEQDSGGGFDADLFHARLLGYDDEVVKEMWIPRAEPVILMPIPQPLWRMDPTEIAPGIHRLGTATVDIGADPMPVARYALQSGRVIISVEAEYEPPVQQLRPDFTARVAYLRYRRRA